jgi:hypothetical protein
MMRPGRHSACRLRKAKRCAALLVSLIASAPRAKRPGHFDMAVVPHPEISSSCRRRVGMAYPLGGGLRTSGWQGRRK